MAEETRSEQLAQKVTPTVRKRLDDTLRNLGFVSETDGHVKWDQDKLLEMIKFIESKQVLDQHENYAEVVTAINQYTALINTKLVSLISDLDASEARIRTDYEDKLASKDKTIRDLQEQRSEQESAKNSAIEDASKSKDARTIAEKNLADAEDRLQKSEDTVRDKESIIQMLTSKLKESDEKLTGYDALRTSESSLRDQVTLLLHQKELAESKVGYEKNQKEESQAKVVDLEKQLAVASGEVARLHDENKSLQRDIKEQKRAAEQTQELAIERAIIKVEKELQEQMTQLRDEKTRLQVQLEGAIAQIEKLQKQIDETKNVE